MSKDDKEYINETDVLEKIQESNDFIIQYYGYFNYEVKLMVKEGFDVFNFMLIIF
jgi:hypothetical protein